MTTSLKKNLPVTRASAALKTLFVADSLAMPVHWFYNTNDIFKAFPDGIKSFQNAPEYHPSSIMSLHSTSHGGRKRAGGGGSHQQIIGDVILKGKRQYWQLANIHYHHQMQAGDNTLNAHCARVLMRGMAKNNGHYDSEIFLNDYIAFMTSDPPRHNDTYAESYHRGFFSNLVNGKAKNQCGAKTHDTASIGGLVTIAPIVLIERLLGTSLSQVQLKCKEHLYLTHPDKNLASICEDYVNLLDSLLFRAESVSAEKILSDISLASIGLNLEKLTRSVNDDKEVIGNKFSSACYIDGSWPGTLYLAYRYRDDPQKALISNTHLGGDNVHRGCVLGVILGLINAETVDNWFNELIGKNEITFEIENLLKLAT